MSAMSDLDLRWRDLKRRIAICAADGYSRPTPEGMDDLVDLYRAGYRLKLVREGDECQWCGRQRPCDCDEKPHPVEQEPWVCPWCKVTTATEFTHLGCCGWRQCKACGKRSASNGLSWWRITQPCDVCRQQEDADLACRPAEQEDAAKGVNQWRGKAWCCLDEKQRECLGALAAAVYRDLDRLGERAAANEERIAYHDGMEKFTTRRCHELECEVIAMKKRIAKLEGTVVSLDESRDAHRQAINEQCARLEALEGGCRRMTEHKKRWGNVTAIHRRPWRLVEDGSSPPYIVDADGQVVDVDRLIVKDHYVASVNAVGEHDAADVRNLIGAAIAESLCERKYINSPEGHTARLRGIATEHLLDVCGRFAPETTNGPDHPTA